MTEFCKMMESLKEEAADLAYLGNAFEATGNEMVAKQLLGAARRIRETVSAIYDHVRKSELQQLDEARARVGGILCTLVESAIKQPAVSN